MSSVSFFSKRYPFGRMLLRLLPVALFILVAACEGQGLAGFPGLSRPAPAENKPAQTTAPPKQVASPAPAKVDTAALPPPAASPAPQPFVPPQSLPPQAADQTAGTIRTNDLLYVPPGEAVPNVLAALPPGGLPSLTVMSGQRLRAALLVPLSGPSSSLGKSLLNAAQMALFDVGGAGFTLLPIDTKGTPEGALAAAQQAVEHGAQIILGPLFSAEVKAVTSVSQRAGVNVIAFSSDSTAAMPGVYLLGFLPRPQVERVVAHASEQGITRFAALAPDTDYGRTMVSAFAASVTAHGGTLVETDYYDPVAKDFTAVVKKLARFDQRKAALAQLKRQLEAKGDKEALARLQKQDTYGDVDYQALFLPDEGGRLRSVAALLPYYDIDTPKVRLLGTMQWDDPTLAAEPALSGAWFAGAPPDGRSDFEAKYRQAFGAKPPRLASLGYDAAALAAVLAQRGAVSSADLMNPMGFAGIDGLFRFLPDGTSERGLAVLEVARGAHRIQASAPSGF